MSTPPIDSVLDPLEREKRSAAVERALQAGVASVYQPIVDMYRGSVVGFEALSRCQVAVGSSVGELFAQAESVGRAGDLEAAALRSALRSRSQVPDNCFLSLNIGTAALANDQVLELLDDQSSLEGVVLEIQHTDPTSSLADAAEGIAACRTKGADIAVAQSRFDIASIETLLVIEPTFVKLGLEVVSGLATNNVKLAVVDSLRHLAESFGVGVIAQGIEDLADMESLRRLGIGFGQGYLFAAPASGMQLDTRLGVIMARSDDPAGSPTVGRFIEAVDELTENDFDDPLPDDRRGIGYEVLVTDLREPVALLRRTGRGVENVPLSLIAQTDRVADVVRMALTRPQRSRFEPFICIDEFGACVGVVRLERLLSALVTADPAAAIVQPVGGTSPASGQTRVSAHRHPMSPHGFRCSPRRR